jgi:hypothetical protein
MGSTKYVEEAKGGARFHRKQSRYRMVDGLLLKDEQNI